MAIKILEKRKYWLVALVLCAVYFFPVPARAENGKGAFFHVGPSLWVPFAGNEKSSGSFLGIAKTSIDTGYGFQIGGGYDFGLLGISTSFHYANFQRNITGAIHDGGDDRSKLYVFDIDTKIFPLGLSSLADAPLRPYLIVGGNALFMDSASGLLGDGYGFGGNFGVGLGLHLSHFFLTLENTYRPLRIMATDPWISRDYTLHVYQGSLNVGFHF